MKRTYKISFFCCLAALLLLGCTDPYALQTRNFENALVIEATITNEMKQHAIKLSRTYRFEEDGPTFETDANVYIEDDLGATINFAEQDTMYVAENAFAPDPQRSYTLHITTSDGKSYSSSPEKQTTVTPIESLNPIVANLGGEQGVKICVNSFDPTGTSKYYRYEYEEAGRFQTPLWSENEIVLGEDNNDPDSFMQIYLLPRTEEAHTCYRKGRSKKIVLTSTNQLSEDRVTNFPIRTIADTSYILNDRYGIKVRQYVQNLASYTFYKTLSELSSNGSILSQNQPGFFYGNIRNDNDASEKVIGYFEVSSVSEMALLFDYNDIFPNNLPIPWPYECTERDLNQDDWSSPRPLGDAHVIINLTSAGSMLFHTWNAQGWYTLASSQCVDCRVTGSNVPPDFWQD